jgi:hypothetical protein
MRVIPAVKIAALALALALPSIASAKTALPPGACAVGKRTVINSGAVCSKDCNPTTMWCAQEMCVNGTVTQVLPCYGTFCSAKCGD